MVDYDSHITYKLKQAINFINKDNFLKEVCEQFEPEVYKDAYGTGLDGFSFKKDPQIEIVVTNLDDNLKNQILSALTAKTEEQIHFLPPAIFDYDFHFSQDPNDTFEKLSSGEKQQIYSIHTIMYHMRNISSVKESEGIIKYRNINIFLDEIELYFHPEMQRNFVNRLLKSIMELKKYLSGNIHSINIILATHSPFILSDIPSQNILRLKEGNPVYDDTQTFGANIHQLLHNDFFLENGFIGEFAKMKINEVVDFLRSINWTNKRDKIEKIILIEKNDQIKEDLKVQLEIIQLELSRIKNLNASLTLEKCKKIIDLVGEPILLQSLNNLYDEVINFKQLKDDFHTY